MLPSCMLLVASPCLLMQPCTASSQRTNTTPVVLLAVHDRQLAPSPAPPSNSPLQLLNTPMFWAVTASIVHELYVYAFNSALPGTLLHGQQADTLPCPPLQPSSAAPLRGGHSGPSRSQQPSVTHSGAAGSTWRTCRGRTRPPAACLGNPHNSSPQSWRRAAPSFRQLQATVAELGPCRLSEAVGHSH